MRSIIAAALLLSTLLTPVSAAPPDAQTLVKRMQAALEPARPGARRFNFTLSQDQVTTQVTVGEARKQIGGVWRSVLTVIAPASASGTAFLIQQGGAGQDTEWFYLPYVRRVRKLVSPEAYSAFFNSDFTYADLGFVDTGAMYTVLGEGTHDGTKTYRLQGVPTATWYYGRWVITLDAETGMPIEREIYDTANQLWKRQRWGRVTVIDGVSLPGDISMEDLQAKSRTDIRMTGADYDVTLPDSLFDPDQLPAAAAAPVWATVGN
jgi:hypothetical protein